MLTDKKLLNQWEIIEKDDRDQMLKYIDFHKPNAKLNMTNEKELCELDHDESIQLLLQNATIRNLILDKLPNLDNIDGQDLDEIDEKEMKIYWKIKKWKHRKEVLRYLNTHKPIA